MRTEDLDFFLPPELIAQTPASDRAGCRLLHYDRASKTITHRIFSDLPTLLRPDDVLVFNDAQVIPARFMLRKNTGGRIEGLFLNETAPGRWHVLLRDAGQAREFFFASEPSLQARVIESPGEGEFEIQLSSNESSLAILNRVGRMPLPPYIKREKEYDQRDDADRQSYQTVYARSPGSVAAPTAGLHFTDEVLKQIDARGIERVHVTLHVGMGTFKPVMTDTLQAHSMHSEQYEISSQAAEALNRAQIENRRIIAVGTTAARVLESYPELPPGQIWAATTAATSIFIYPPYRWKRVNALLTNFHLPRSTLIALVAAMVGLEEQRRIYTEAIAQRYHFFSYGDAMLIE
jgi:S-adenosylmethionine:tRNA ribosyltransferase-isomerase